MSFQKILNEAANSIGLSIDSDQESKFMMYHKLLIEWNKKVNLTSITNKKEVIIKHFIDSLTVSKYIADNSLVLDIGTGGGFPGIPLKIYNPTIKLTLIDSVLKKTLFLKELIRKLGLNNVEIIHTRAEDISEKLKNIFNFVIFRAFGDFEKIFNSSKSFLNEDGKIIVMKGPNGLNEYDDYQRNNKNNCINLIKYDQFELPLIKDKRVNFVFEY